MIITRSPLRITLGGGGTDLLTYYREFGGFLISAAINKYVYVTVMRPFNEGIYLKYSQLEKVQTADEVRHPIIREAIKLLDFKTPQLEITALADIPGDRIRLLGQFHHCPAQGAVRPPQAFDIARGIGRVGLRYRNQ